MVFRVVNLLRSSSLRNGATSARNFHTAAILAKKKDKPEVRYMKPCPESEVPNCNALNRKSCSPTARTRPCSEEECSEPKPSCCVNKRIAESPCTESGNSKDFKKRKSPFNTMWETYEGKKYAPPVVQWDFPKDICCPQCDAYRFDVLYYTPGNKNRTYQRTWWECTPRMVPKRVCCWCDAVPPQVERRTQEEMQQCACAAGHEKKRMECLDKNFKGCPRLQMPCCRTARIPPSCKIWNTPSDCEKVRCPFPSYSECLQEEPANIPGRPRECKCLDHNPICEQIRRAQHMHLHNISLFPCGRGEKEDKEE